MSLSTVTAVSDLKDGETIFSCAPTRRLSGKAKDAIPDGTRRQVFTDELAVAALGLLTVCPRLGALTTEI
jgi:hypothetical protein